MSDATQPITQSKEVLALACAPLHRRFAERYAEIVASGSPLASTKIRVQAAIDVGYSAKSAQHLSWQLVGRPEIAAYIQCLLDQISKRNALTPDWVLDKLHDEATQLERKGSTQASRVRALELIGKAKGMFADERPTVVVPVKVFVGVNLDEV